MAFVKLTEEQKAANKAARQALKASEPDAADLPEPKEEEAPAEEAPSDEPESFKKNLSAAAIAEITRLAKAKVQQEITKAEKDKFMAAEVERLRAEAGLAAPTALGGTHDELVTFTLDLGYEAQAWIQINQPHGPKYYHGGKYTTPRHVFNTLNEIAFAGHKLTKHVEGKSVYRNRNYGTVVSPRGVTNEVVH